MKIHEIIKKRGKSVSFEFFPPKEEAGEKRVLGVAKQLATLGPDFVSVTYGAGGGTGKRTASLIKQIKEGTALTPMPHLTCINQGETEMRTILDGYRRMGVENVLALRGDPPQETTGAVAPYQGEDGLRYAKDLVALVKTYECFSIGVACYPEGHLEAPSREMDLSYTKQKIDAGAHFAITQMFFENRFYYDFLDRAGKIGITVPIIPGIMPILDLQRTRQFCDRCGATIPVSLAARMEGATPEDRRRIGREFAIEQCADLMKQGVRYFHFYTMNQAETVTEIFKTLSLNSL
jgi:methylenetetrahydrofolate reductase (NADPH)